MPKCYSCIHALLNAAAPFVLLAMLSPGTAHGTAILGIGQGPCGRAGTVTGPAITSSPLQILSLTATATEPGFFCTTVAFAHPPGDPLIATSTPTEVLFSNSSLFELQQVEVLYSGVPLHFHPDFLPTMSAGFTLLDFSQNRLLFGGGVLGIGDSATIAFNTLADEGYGGGARLEFISSPIQADTPVPESSTFTLIGVSLVGLGLCRSRPRAFSDQSFPSV